jgi:hypothetical protein
MKRYILSLLVGLVLVLLGDYLIGSTLKYFYFKSTSGNIYRTTYSIEKTEADILIFGSSRANHHYDSKLIEKMTGLSTYNTGRDGNSIFYHTAILKSILIRHTPKQIILDFDSTFKYNQEDYDKISSLLPYYSSHKELRGIIELKSSFEKYKLASKIYPYNSLLSTIAIGNLGINNTRIGNKSEYNGFVPVDRIWKNKIDSLETSIEYEIDNNKLDLLEEFIKLTKEKEIPLIIVYSPVYYLYDKNYTIDICSDICRKNDVTFVDFSKDSEFLRKRELFGDISHLNNDGAKLLTMKLLKMIDDNEETY